MPLESNIADAIPLPVLTLTSEACVKSANIEAQDEINLSETAMRGRHICEIFAPESDVHAMIAHLQQTGQPISDHNLYLRTNHAPCALHLGAMGSNGGGFVAVMAPEANRQELETHARRQQMAEAVSRIALEVAHEVKNPLAALGGAAQWLAEQLSDAEQQDAVRMILAEVEIIRRRIDDFLQLGPRAAVQEEEVNIHQLIDEVCRPPNGVALQRVFDPSLPPVRAQRGRLRQAVENLWRNALEAGATSIEWQTRINPTVTLPEHKGPVLEMRISNDGEAIPEAIRERIFEPFVTGKQRGSGLGLALVQRIAQEHGGQVSLSAESGRTRVALRLPLNPAAGEEHECER